MNAIDEVRRVPSAGTAAKRREPVTGYDELGTQAIITKLKTLSQRRLKLVRAYEKAHQARTSVLHAIGRLTADQPWANYDAQPVKEIITILSKADADTARQVLDYEREHRARAGVITAAEHYRLR